MLRINNHEVINGDVEVYDSDHPLEYTSDYIPDPYNIPITPMDDVEM